ncbi:Zinc finger protein ZIC 4 [Coemansia sp. RSA 25]|nr:Zinc finger protein ZIC 4 [Coemansia sp. RSA 25]
MATPDIEPAPSTQAPGPVVAVAARVVCAWQACSVEFDSTHSLASHLSICHLEPEPHARHACLWQDCPQYDVPALTRYDLILHLKAHTGDRAYLCPFDGCNKSYIRSEFLPRHIINTHANSDAAAALLSARQTPARAKPRRAAPRTEPLVIDSSGSDSESDGDDALLLPDRNNRNHDQAATSKRRLSAASDSDSYHLPLSAASEPTEAMLEAQLAYIREQVADRTKKLTRVKDKSRRLRLENDILLDAIENA